MNKLWMKRSFSVGIPTSFVVDRDGHIAFIGHPTELDEVLPKVLNGSWRTSDEAKAADKERIAKNEPMAREQALKKPINDRFWAAVKTEDWKTALSAIEEGITLLPDNLNFRLAHANVVLHKMHDMWTGLPLMHQLVRDAIDRNSEDWMIGTLNQLFHPNLDHSRFPSPERFAIGKKLSEHVLALNPPQADSPKFWSYPAVARYYHESGNKNRAIELVELALKSLDGPEPIPDELKEHLLPELLQALANYKDEKVCRGALCAAPQKNFLPKVSKRRPKGVTVGMCTGHSSISLARPQQVGSMQHSVDRLQRVRGSNLAMTSGRTTAEAMLDANSGRGGRPRSQGRVQGRPLGHPLRGIGRPEPGSGCASLPEVGVPENRHRASRKRTEMRRRRNV